MGTYTVAEGNDIADAQVTLSAQDAASEGFGSVGDYPNPFNPETWIPFRLCESASVRITVFDASGKTARVLDLGSLPAGMYASRSKAAYWDGRNASGERVAWEMNPVRRGDGTLFLSGSHKSNYPLPEGYRDYEHPIYEDYDCSAGSAVVFSENVCHSSAPWTNPTTQRITVFNHYIHRAMKFHKGTPPHEATMEMPLRRRSPFRGVWMADFPPGKIIPNDYYDEENRAL